MPNYSGMWTSRQQLQAIGAGSWPGYTPPLGPADAQFNYVTMLLPGNGTNGAQNNTFLDSSTNNFTITRNGNTTQGTFSPYDPAWSNNFPGSALINSTVTNVGTGQFTAECWVKFTVAPTGYVVVMKCSDANGAWTNGWNIVTDGSGKIGTYNGGGTTNGIQNLPANQWYHLALTRDSSNTLRFFIDGVLSGSATSVTTNYSSTAFSVGGDTPTSYTMQGYVSNARFVSGTALYTSDFTPSAVPLTAVSGTQILTCQSNRFVDTGPNSYSLTVTGAPSIQRLSPFGATTPYTTASIGGSGYFDGTGDYLSYANSTTVTPSGTETFTIECWVYPTLLDTYKCVYSAGWPLQIYLTAAGTAEIYVSSTDAAGGYFISGQTGPAASIAVNRWAHVALVRNGNNFTVYVNGVAGTTSTFSNSIFASTSDVNIGRFGPTAVYPFNGYISNLRVVRGTAVYTSAFTPPSSPVTAISGTQALLNMTNAAIYDNAMMSDLETVGNAQISTAQSKFGGSSMYFDATANTRLSIPKSKSLNLVGDFTIEMWVRFISVSSYRCLLETSSDGLYGNEWAIFKWTDSTIVVVSAGTNPLASTTVVVPDTWYYVATTKSGSTSRLFINGVLEASTTASNAPILDQNWYVGDRVASAGSANYPLEGYINDLRITNGYARYTSTFTPPTTAFPTYGPV